MKILLISDDQSLIEEVTLLKEESDINLDHFAESADSFDIASYICSVHPSIVILDDDLVQPNSEKIIKFIRNLYKTLPIIFVTSDSSVVLGRSISQLAVSYYAIKPLGKKEIQESLHAVIELKQSE